MSGRSSTPLLFGSLRGYRAGWLRADLVAGLTVWAVLVPESLAYATIAGVPPVVGLYAAVPALLLYGLLGSSRHLVVASMSATAALSAGIVGDLADGGSDRYVALTTALAVVVGLVGLAAGLARMGFLASFISEPVLKGFIIGLALTIIVGQLPKLFGVPKGDGDFFEQLVFVIANLGDTIVPTLIVGGASLLLVLLLRRWLPLVPGALVAVLLGIAAVALLDLDQEGVAIVGQIDAGLPRLGLPHAQAGDYLTLIGASVGVLLIGYAEGLGAAKTYAAKAGYDVDPNRELLGLGAANLGAGLASGMVVNGSLSKTAVNGGAGAKSQLSGLTVAALTVITLLFLTGLFEQLPEATLAAVVIAAVLELVDVPALRRLYRVWTPHLGGIYGWAARADFLAAIAALLGVLVFDTLPGLFIGIAVSLVLLLYRASRPHIARLARGTEPGMWLDLDRHPDLTPDPAVLVLRVESGLFFANADHVRDHVRGLLTESTCAVVLDAQTAPFIDVTATGMLTQLAHDLTRRHVTLAFAHPIGQTRDVLRRAAASSGVTLSVYPDVDAAVMDTRSRQDEPTSPPGDPAPPASSPRAGEAPRRTEP
ncbi:SulP family inorganic anion transporter [Geodermatophilus sabuli]|uniref:High affinity sulphate transporter 1 n=1 Tax=Geodermatophilus sabuli TaxID=1564158 RepID=A0A285EH22_9ACTN|nr:SulP family inorganic anion transporter [Geodermatophilus sabuli]MBB3086034.1 high affinity sulfate transporter 1 [Geodermatophilus sabuli]SNX98375.1 high affinity sulphate transporter 1 [Geodermatophilus sabuli]